MARTATRKKTRGRSARAGSVKRVGKKVGKKVAGGARVGVAAKARRAGKRVLKATGLNKPAVKKRVITKLKRVGTAMAQAALNELLPQQGNAAGSAGSSPAGSNGQGKGRARGAARSGGTLARNEKIELKEG